MNTQTPIPPVVLRGEPYTVSFEERIADFLGPNSDSGPVLIRQVCFPEHEQYVNTEAVLQSVDRNAPWRTFMVRVPNCSVFWVHNVTRPEAVSEEPATASESDLLQTRLTLQREAEARHEAFRTQVRDVAIRVAEEQGWCDDGLNDVLDELGLDPKEFPRQRITVKVTRTFTIEATPNRLDPDEEWTKASLSLDGFGDPTLDGDWFDENVSCDDEDFEVEGMTEA